MIGIVTPVLERGAAPRLDTGQRFDSRQGNAIALRFDDGIRNIVSNREAAMADKDPPKSAFDPAGFGQFGGQQAEAFTSMQRELFSMVEEANKNWMKRAELERDMATELVTSLSAAKTLPDAAKAYQDWMTKRMQTLTEDGQKLFSESQKFITAATKFMPPGMPKRD